MTLLIFFHYIKKETWKKNIFFVKIYHLFLLYERHRRKMTYNHFVFRIGNVENTLVLLMKNAYVNSRSLKLKKRCSYEEKNTKMMYDTSAWKNIAVSFLLIKAFDTSILSYLYVYHYINVFTLNFTSNSILLMVWLMFSLKITFRIGWILDYVSYFISNLLSMALLKCGQH